MSTQKQAKEIIPKPTIRSKRANHFLRELGQVARHPIASVSIGVVALTGLSALSANAQDKPLAENKDRTENTSGPKVKETVKVTLEDGYLTIDNRTADIREKLKAMGLDEKASDKSIVRVIEVDLGGVPGVYLIFDKAIARININDSKFQFSGVYGKDKLFTNEGAIYIAANGSIVASTPTELLAMTPSDWGVSSYKSLFGDVPKLTKPKIGKGKDDKHADIRDEVMVNGTERLKIEVQLEPKIMAGVVPDLLAMGSN